MVMKFELSQLKFNEKGLIPAIAQDFESETVLMLAWMNIESIQETLKTKRVTYWSRSRSALWEKGATSGHTQDLIEFRYDCDNDAVLVLVKQRGPACHTNRISCFFNKLVNENESIILE
jgi:phosphoribosyl-AMP cyclohydrolase